MVRIGFGIAALLPLPQSVRNVLLLFCIVTTTSQVHTDFHGAQHPLHRPCVSSQVRWENDGNALADQLMLPCWVEASLEGYHLYSSCGCEDVEKEYRQTEYHQTESFGASDGQHGYELTPEVTKMEGKALENR